MAVGSRANKAGKPAAAKPSTKDAGVDLLAGLDDGPQAAAIDEDSEEFDLLDDLTEETGTPWMPWVETDQPTGIQGRVTHVGTVFADEAYGGGEKPLVEIVTDDGTQWSIRGYSTVLQGQIEKTDPQVGDVFAVKYFGLKEPRKGGKPYHNAKVAVRRA